MGRTPQNWLSGFALRYLDALAEHHDERRQYLLKQLSDDCQDQIGRSPSAYETLIQKLLLEWCADLAEAPLKIGQRRSMARAYEDIGESEAFEVFLVRQFPSQAYRMVRRIFRDEPSRNTVPILIVLVQHGEPRAIAELMQLISQRHEPALARQTALALITLLRPSHFYKHAGAMFDDPVDERVAWPDDEDLEAFVINIGKRQLASILPDLDYQRVAEGVAPRSVNRLFDVALLREKSPYRLYGPNDEGELGEGGAAAGKYRLVDEEDYEDLEGVVVEASSILNLPDPQNLQRISNMLDLFTLAANNAAKTGRFGSGSTVNRDGSRKNNVVAVQFGRRMDEQPDDGGDDDID